jgi:hypothetical protein
MDQERIDRHLAEAEEHVASGDRLVFRQRAIVTYLAREGHDTSQAQSLLATFEETLRLHMADLDRLRRKQEE